MSLINISAVFLGGGLGAVARYGLGAVLTRSLGAQFPWHTLVINIAGSLGIGLIIGGLAARADAGVWRLFLATGLMGGFTTFSAFALESVSLVQRGSAPSALIYALASVGLCVVACFAGLKVMS